MFQIRKLFVSGIFTILAIGLFLTCDDPNNPFTNSMGEKVVVEPPYIFDVKPVSTAFLNGKVTITGIAKAYAQVTKVEVYIFANSIGQKEVKWTNKLPTAYGGTSVKMLPGPPQQKKVELEFDTSKFNNGKDGQIQLKFRVYDTTPNPVESTTLTYTIKNNPSVITMSAPSNGDIAKQLTTSSNELPKVYYGSDLRGTVTDERGLRPGFPQIKLWPESDAEPGDEGWATLFLDGYDDMQKESIASDGSAVPAGPGEYANRTEQRVVNYAQFSLRLAKYTIEQPDPGEHGVRKIKYDVVGGKHDVSDYGGGKVFNFRIRTRDVEPDKERFWPTHDPDPIDPSNPPWIEGFFPPKNYWESTMDQVDNFKPRDEPGKFIIFSSDSRPSVELYNKDIPDDVLNATPNIYITEPMSKKIFQTDTTKNHFRLQIFVTLGNGATLDAGKPPTLEVKHETTTTTLNAGNGLTVTNPYTEHGPGGSAITDARTGILYTYTAPANSPIFKNSNEPYALTFRVYIPGLPDPIPYVYYVYLDGNPPDVKVIDIKGKSGPPAKDVYTVNGNVQVTVDRSDASGIMPYKENAGLGSNPPEPDDYPMVKWIVEKANPAHTVPPVAAQSDIFKKLDDYKKNPSYENLRFFLEIEDTYTSGWVKRPLPDNAPNAREEDKKDNFKLNTKYFTPNAGDKEYLWLYVIAMDQVQNLGYTVKKLYIDQSTDDPNPSMPALSDKNIKGTTIADGSANPEKNLDVKVTIKVEGTANTVTRETDGNWEGAATTDINNGKRNNVLGRNANISITLADDDGIDLENGGVTIVLTDLNTPKAVNSPATFSSANPASLELLKRIINAGTKTDLSGNLTQDIMAEALYGKGNNIPTSLKDGMYSLKFTIKDDIKEKIAITPYRIDGDTPTAAQKEFTFYFAVATEKPEIEIIAPKDNELGSKEPLNVYGTVKSRLDVQNIYISFSPDVFGPSDNQNSGPRMLELWADPAYTKARAQAVPDAEGFYTYYWSYEKTYGKGVVFHPEKPGGGVWFNKDKYNGLRFYSVEAYDRLGYKNVVEQKVLVDDAPPKITLVEFNYSRPVDKEDGKLKLYGKVSFTVTASDSDGIWEDQTGKDANGNLPDNRLVGIKWWVLPFASSPPSWGDAPTTITKTALAPRTTWTAGGQFKFNQARNGGQYTGVIDTRYLDDNAEYKFYVMAMDKAGNTARIEIGDEQNIIYDVILLPDINVFTVDQSRDNPYIYKNTLNPLPNNVLGNTNGDLTISGTVGDADLFKPANKNAYVEIRFPTLNPQGQPSGWTGWIPIIGDIDPAGDIIYKFNPNTNTAGTTAQNNAAKTYLTGDGIKYYQIRVTDEPVGPTDDEKIAGARWYGKNPDQFMRSNPAYPNYDTTVWLNHDKTSIIFGGDNTYPPTDNTAPTQANSFTFFVDNSKPEIFFNMFDPAKDHENFIATRPTFSKWTQLKDALNNLPLPLSGKGNYVKEYKLVDLTMSWSAGNNTFIKVLLSNPPDPATAGEYPWDLKAFTAKDDTDFEAVFNSAPQGLQVISFEATDMVPLTGRASWIFAKDTQGPDINFTNINRAIKRASIPANPPGSGDTAWPTNWPLNKTEYWPAWTDAWKTLMTNWPSEYAFKKAAEVIAQLKKENSLSPSTVIGDTNTLPVIEGSFSDEYSTIRILVPPANPDPTYFYYRFKSKDGAIQAIPPALPPQVTLDPGVSVVTGLSLGYTDGSTFNGSWLRKQIEKAGTGQSAKEADWKIVLNEANGFTGSDGENLLDIRVADTAGNISEIYNVRFLVDRAPPKLGHYTTASTPEFKEKEFKISEIGGAAPTPALDFPLPQDQRVISAVVNNNTGTGKVFSISGRVNDYNLNNLRITIGQDGSAGYTVSSTLIIDPLTIANNSVTTAPEDKIVKNGIETTDTGVKRLTLAGPYNPHTITPYNSTTEPPEWEWTLDILEKDVYGLREAVGIGTDAEFSARRFIRVTASDKAGKTEGPVEWSFYLDTRKPVIEYTNLDKGRKGSSFERDVKLQVSVSDDTKIKDVKYTIGKWNYATNRWQWYTGGNWTDTQPAVTTWPSAFTDAETPKRSTTMSFTINKGAPGTAEFPADLFETEGQYRLDLYVTDFSIGSGNPHSTLLGNNKETGETGEDGKAFQDYDLLGIKYDPKTGAGNASARVFYFDKNDPILKWASTIEDKTYFRNETEVPNKGQVIFGFIAGDGNTLTSWSAVIKDKNGKIVSTDGTNINTTETGTIKWEAGTGKPATIAIAEPKSVASTTPPTTAGNTIADKKVVTDQYFEIKPFMTVNATDGGTALDMVADNSLPTYSITLTVKDGAERTSSITKQFTLDNTPPNFVQDKFSPQSYRLGDKYKPYPIQANDPVPAGRVYSYEARTGGMNIRGNTTDNSNQIKNVSYYVVNKTESSNWGSFPNPKTLANAKWRYSGGTGDSASEIKSGGTTLIEIDQGTFAWTIMVPNTTLLLEGASPEYVQKTLTSGLTINGVNKPEGADTKYKDINFSPDLSTWSIVEKDVPRLKFASLNNPFVNLPLTDPRHDSSITPTDIYGGEDVGLITVYVRAEDAAGNVNYDILQYWIWPEGDRPIITQINTPNSSAGEMERLLNGTIRLAGMAKDNERVEYVWFRVLNTSGVPYKLNIPKWKDKDNNKPIGGNWEEAGGLQDSVAGSTIGRRRTDDPLLTPPATTEDGWYMANGGHSREVSWWAYINTNGELDPQGTEEKREFIVQVRAQDVSYDVKNDQWLDYVTNGYRGMTSAMTTISRTNAWVVANAPVFDKYRIASVASDKVTDWEAKENNNTYTYSVDNVSIRERSSYKVTVTHNIGLSAIRWSPTQWYKDKNVAADIGAFRTNPNIDAFNLLATNITDYTRGTSYVWLVKVSSNSDVNKNVYKYEFGDQTAAFAALTAGTTDMAAHVVIKDSKAGYPIDCDVFVDMRADLLLSEMLVNDPDYGKENIPARAGQTKNSVRYPLYMSASDISKATPLSSRGDTLLPIDNLPPYGMYTLNRKPAGTAVTIGGEAGDNGPVNGVARVVVWFQRGADGVSWHETQKGTNTAIGEVPEATLNAGTFTAYPVPDTSYDGPAWWKAVTRKTSDTDPNDKGVLPASADVKKPYIPALNAAGADTGAGASAIVIDIDSPSKGIRRWGHELPMGFADGGLGKIWYVQINSYNLKSGPVDMHYVIIDKAGNAKYYKEKLVIMNNVAVIDRVKLATDIRQTTWTGGTPSLSANNSSASGKKYDDKTSTGTWPILDQIRAKVTLGTTDIQKGVSDWVSASALGAGKVIDFNVRNKLFALRVETTKEPGPGKSRNFRLEYVSGARLMTSGTPTAQQGRLTDIKAGRVYIINNPGTAKWGMFGAEGDEATWKKRGYAFIATVSGSELDDVAKANIGTGTAWELNNDYDAIGERIGAVVPNAKSALRLADAKYTTPTNAESAEFVYSATAFGTDANASPTSVNTIVDCNGAVDTAFPPAPNAEYSDWTAWNNKAWSLFILRVFDGPEDHQFGDFTILRVRVNNDDKTPPFAQLYDLNPKTEGQERPNIAQDDRAVELKRSISPLFIGEGANSNRVKGGLWNDETDLQKVGSVTKPGHIEPRKINSIADNDLYKTQQHSLSSAQMGGAETLADATITKPFANPAGFFTMDTVSGKVVLRGYAEDDQRIQKVALRINNTDIDILVYPTGGTQSETQPNSATYTSPKTGMLAIPTAQANNVYYTDSIDLYRHRVEWAYIWDTETIPGGNSLVGNNISVRVVSYNRNNADGTKDTSGEITETNGKLHVDIPDKNDPIEATRPYSKPFNPGFPTTLKKYNSINVNIRPYITGFLRNKTLFSHDTRSRQGRYMFYRTETAVLKGFNLGTGTIKINNGTDITTANVGTPGDFGITTANNNHYRQFTVGAGVTTGNGLFTYTFNTRDAVNTGGERAQLTGPVRPTYIQPWNIEYSSGIAGSRLWDDFTQVHIWQSNDTNANADRGYFPKGGANMEVFDPSMTIDPATGTLWSSHNEGGGGNGSNSGSTKVQNNNGVNSFAVASFIDPIINSDIFISTRPSGYNGNSNAFTVWSAYSIIGKPGGGTSWASFGGVWLTGPQGGNPNLTNALQGNTTNNNGFTGQNDVSARTQYMAESTYYNSQANPPAAGPQLNQFKNPHIISYWDNTNEHIHVSYYDTKDGSIKYRYNRRGQAETVNGTGAPKAWTNLDGGIDQEDRDTLTATGPFPAANASERVVNHATRSSDAGEYNSIAVTSQGYPVVAYYDNANQKLRLAISNDIRPVLGTAWRIEDNVIPADQQLAFTGTGMYVSMKIDTRTGATQNTVHIAAMNSLNKSLVYIKGTLGANRTYTFNTVQVVDSVGSVGRWCALSLDSNGNPWISYQDESYQGSRDGIKLAYYNDTIYYKGRSGGAGGAGGVTYRPNEDVDMFNKPINGWEAMHVPTAFRVANARQGMECYPVRNPQTFTGTAPNKDWTGAVAYLGEDYFRVAYYIWKP